jgi:predicted acetyltransferase
VGGHLMVELIESTKKEKSVFENLIQLYLYDMSEQLDISCEENGKYLGISNLDYYFDNAKSYPYLIFKNSEIIGFVLICGDSKDESIDYSIDEFFILNKFQGSGLGAKVALKIFNRFPGQWKIEQIPSNKLAIKFWRKVIFNYTNGSFDEFIKQSEFGKLNLLTFNNSDRLN